MSRRIFDYLGGRKILILGFGREGKSSYNFLRKYDKDMPLSIADKMPVEIDDKNVTLFTGENYLDAINEHDVVLKSPGISLRDFKKNDSVEITCQTDLFLKYAPLKKIGVTGTKGKTTTTTLIFKILEAAGMKACLIGNMGVPVFDSFEGESYDIAAIEMSSHQLEYTRNSPDISVITNIYPEHLDHYNGFSGYVNAKLNILRYQTENGFIVYNKDQGLDEYIDLSEIKGEKKAVSAHTDDEFLKELGSSNKHLKGIHNQQDIFFASAVAKHLGIENEAIKKGIADFQGIEHRMESVGVFKGIEFFNDCIATIPHATLCAVEALGNVGTLIVGGMDRGIDYTMLEDGLMKLQLDNIIGLPDTGHTLADKLVSMGSKSNILKAKDMEDAVRLAYEVTESGKSCILSPAASSYNVYKNFEFKGRHFKSLVVEIGKGVSDEK